MIVSIGCLLSVGVLFAWITKEPVGLPEMDLAIAGCASTYYKAYGKWPQSYAQVEKSCDSFERRIISQIKTRSELSIETEPISDGIRIQLRGHYRGDFKHICEVHFAGDSMTLERK